MSKKNAGDCLDAFLSLLESERKINFIKGRPLFRGITLMPPRRTFGHGVLLVGDVAGQVKPVTGGGIYFGLLCADMAADTLHNAMEAGDFSAYRLSSYQKAWKNLLGRELRLGSWAHRLYVRMSDARIDRLLEFAARRGLLSSLEKSSAIGFDWHGSAMLHVIKRMMRLPARGQLSEKNNEN